MRRHFANIAGNLIPCITFSITGKVQAIYLTFDDGPHPESTPRILELLERCGAKATFFCIGQNVENYPSLYESILSGGHAAGNHTWSHPDGWRTSAREYLADTDRAAHVIGSKLFRPPYGRITPGQYLQLRKKFEIIMWTRQFADYRPGFKPEKPSLAGISPGDILVLHDTPSSISNTLPLLKRLLDLKGSGTLSHFPAITNTR